MKKLFAGSVVTLLALTLTGCTIFYPNWGQKTAPVDTPSASATPDPSSSPSSTPTVIPPKPVDVEILQVDPNADNSTISVIAQATGIVEDTGICTLTVTQGSVKKSISAKAESNVTDTQCFALNLSIVGLAPGDATFNVSYDSKNFTGASSPQAITIP